MKLEEFFHSASGGCQAPGCTHPHGELVLNSVCHPGEPTWVTVDSKKRTIEFACSVCNKLVFKIECPILN